MRARAQPATPASHPSQPPQPATPASHPSQPPQPATPASHPSHLVFIQDTENSELKEAFTGLDGHTIAGLRRKHQRTGFYKRPDDTPSIAQAAPYVSPSFAESMRQTDENLRRINGVLAAARGADR